MSSGSRIGVSPRPKEIKQNNSPQIYEEEKVTLIYLLNI